MSGAISAISAAGATAAAAGAGTAGIAGAALSANALSIASLGSMALTGVSSIEQGREQAESAKYNSEVQANNATIATQNANLAGAEGAANAAIEQQKTRAQVGGIKAAQAANGVDVNTGSNVDVRSSAAELGELNAITIRSNAAKTAYGYQTQSVSDTAQSQLDQSQSKYAAEAGYVNAGSTLLSSAVKGGQSGLWGNYLSSNSLMPGGADNPLNSSGDSIAAPGF